MKRATLVWFLLLLFPALIMAQGVSCPAVIAGPDTTLNCNDCVRLHATPVSGFTTTSYTVQQIPYNPYPFNSGTPILVNIDDIWSGILPIGFDFCFYGNSYNQCVIGSNGVVSFNTSYANQYCAWPISQGIPGNTDVLNSILGAFHDIDPSIGGNIYWQQYGVAPCRVFVVSFFNVPMFSCTNLINTQQIVLYETTNIIEVYLQNKPTCSGWNAGAAIEGIQNATGTLATVVPGRNFPGTWTAANDARAFVPAGAPNYTIAWYEVGNPVPLTNLDTITVCPASSQDYYAEVVYTNCNGATVTVRDTASINASSSSMTLGTSHTDVSCNGSTNGTATVTISGNSGPTTIQWSNGGSTSTISGLAAGTYTVTVSEQGGCAATATAIVAQPPVITVAMSNSNVLCNGQSTGTASVVAGGGSGGFSYAWSNGMSGSSISGLPAGSYTVTVTDGSGCQNTGSVNVTQPAVLAVSLNFSNVTCFGGANGTATAFVSGGAPAYQYLWSTGATTPAISGLAAGTYSVTITDNNGCTASSAVTVIEPAALAVSAVGFNVSCFGANNGSATANVAGGTAPFQYVWSNGGSTGTINNLPLGTYSVTVTDANGCTGNAAVTLTEPTAIVLTTQHVDVLCNGLLTGSATATASGGTGTLNYAWSNGATTSNISGLPAGTYTVTVTDANACFATSTVIVTEPALLTISAVGTDVICFGEGNGTATSTVAGGTLPYQYLWSNGSINANLSGLQAGNYSVTVTDAHGCPAATSVVIAEPPLLTLQISGDTRLCAYDSLHLSSAVGGGSPSYSYNWYSTPTAAGSSTPELTYIANETRTYTLEVTDQHGCRARQDQEVVSIPTPIIEFYPDRSEACDSVTIFFTNVSVPNDLSWQWTFSDGGTSTYTNPDHFFDNGIWSVTLTGTTSEGCTASLFEQNLIRVIPTPVASFVTDPNITVVDYILLSQASIAFNNTSPWYASSVDWSFGNGDSAFVGSVYYTYPDTGYFCVTMNAYNDFGCHDDTTQCLVIKQDPFLWVPNGFTPNGDGLNDVFQIGGVEISTFNILIFDRWGRLIFESNSMERSWDGKAINEDAPEGAYVFKIDAVNKLGQKFTRAGTVTLIR